MRFPTRPSRAERLSPRAIWHGWRVAFCQPENWRVPFAERFAKLFSAGVAAAMNSRGGASNAQATGGSYRQAFGRTRSYMDHLTAVDQAIILGKTAARLFGFTTT